MTRLAYFVNDSIRLISSDLIVCIAKEGEKGYYKTGWYYGKDLERADSIVRDLNTRLGLSDEDVMTIQASTF